MTTGEKIKTRRLELGLTAEELGKKVGVTKSTIGRYESGTIAKIPYLTFVNIAAVLQTMPEDLISKEEFEPASDVDGLEVMNMAFNDATGKLRERIRQMTPVELDRMNDFAQGILAARPEGEPPSR